MSALARAMCLPIAILAGPSCIEFIMVVVLAMLSAVHFIIAADAGDSASAENIAAVTKIIFMKSLPWNETGVLPAFEVRILHRQCFREKLILRAALQRFACAGSRPQGPVPHAGGERLSVSSARRCCRWPSYPVRRTPCPARWPDICRHYR